MEQEACCCDTVSFDPLMLMELKKDLTSYLQKQLVESDMRCVPDGIHSLQAIYDYVKEKYPELCNDGLLCRDVCDDGDSQPEWQHRVRTVLSSRKGKGRINKEGIEKGQWQFLPPKLILDACCGGRMMWFEKQHPNATYMDIRAVEPGAFEARFGQKTSWAVQPDILGDYRDMDFEDETFEMVVWDIPHKLKPDKGLITMKYGALGTNWQEDTQKGFNEIWRVLKPGGVLLFKYADLEVKVSEMLGLFPVKPLFGTVTKKGVNNTYWFCFKKIE